MSLQIWLPLNGNLENQGLSNLNFSITNNVVVNNNGKIGKCYYNESPTFKIGQIISDNSINLGINQSMFCWVKFNTLCSASSLTGLVSQHNPIDQTNMGVNIRYVSETTGYLTVSTGTGSARTYNRYYGTTLLQAETWYHVGYTYDGTTIRLYVNGQLDKTYTFVDQLCTNEKIVLFAWNARGTSTNYKLNGYLNDVRIYDHCLSQKEIEEISKGLILHYKLDNNGYNNLLTSTVSRTVTVPDEATSAYTAYWYFNTDIKNKNLFENNPRYTVTYDYTVNNLSESSTSAYLYSQLNTSRSTPAVSQTGFRTNTNGHVIETFTVDDTQKAYSSTFRFRIRLQTANPGDSVTISNLRIYLCDQNEINYISDSSGYHNNGDILGNLLSETPSIKYQSCMRFNGIDNAICAYREPMVTDAITVSCWGYMEDWSQYNEIRLISCTQAGGWNFESTSSGYLNFAMATGVSSYTYTSASSITSLSDLSSGWHFFVGTYDGFSTKLYIDKQLEKSNEYYTEKTPIFYNVNNGIFIGAESVNSQTVPLANSYFNGLISDVRIYATALTQEYVNELYNISMSIDNSGNTYVRELVE